MRRAIVVGAAIAALAAWVRPGAAQGVSPAPVSSPDSARSDTNVADDAHTTLGITVSTSGTDRDTLGLLAAAVTPGGPAERGGIDPGNRLAEVNNVSLRIDPADVGRRESEEAAMRLLAREVQATQPGDYVRFRLFGAGRYRTMAIQIPRPDTAGKSTAAPPSKLQGVVDGIGVLRAQLDGIMQEEAVPVPRDTLLQAERDLGVIERRLRAAQAAPRHSDNNIASLPGLRVAAVVDELKDYFGEGSEGGLLVVGCDASWDPIRNGDVILRVNGEPANIDRLRGAVDPEHQTRVDLLRRGRYLMVTLHPHD
jgi:S1-C subfamily serine protease